MSTSTPTARLIEATHGKPLSVVLRDLYDGEGLSQEAVAARLNVSRWTVMQWMAECGIPTRDRRKVA
jgi:DNA-binding transcriptional regulator YiaG